MRQTTLCVPLEVKPESSPHLADLLTDLRRKEDANQFGGLENFSRLQVELPAAHFLSMSIFTHASYDPVLVIEANFDGEPGPFWAQFERALGAPLREILRCCKRPGDGSRELHDAVTGTGSTAPIAPYLERRTQQPSVSHQGNRGLTRDRIRVEAKLAEALESELDGDAGYRAMRPAEIHRELRRKMMGHFPWLAEPAPERTNRIERVLDWVRAWLFASVVLAVLLLPGALLATALGAPLYLGVLTILAVVAGFNLHREGGLPSLFGFMAGLSWRPVAIVLLILLAVLLGAVLALYLLPALAKLALALLGHVGPPTLWSLFQATLGAALWSLPSLLPLGLGLAWLVRWNERRDSRQDAPPLDKATLDRIARLEDRTVQNHMGSVVLVRPGVMRSMVIRVGHLGLHLVLRVLPRARNGFLGTMRTVHFAHWAFLNNGSRLLFLSNYDHSWDSYLDDFIEKAHEGLTLAWGCGVGFPATHWLVFGGAEDGRRFKTWALASRAMTRFWYSAYPKLTVNRIEQHAKIAEGLRRETMDDNEARAWLRLM